MGYNLVTVGGTATLILEANAQRQSLIIINGGSDILHIGPDASITPTNSIYLVPDGHLEEDSGGTKMWMGDIYGISTGGTCDVFYWERTR